MPSPFVRRCSMVTLLAATSLALPNRAQEARSQPPVPRAGLEVRLWARDPMLQDPVAIHFDDQGRLYVAETARRSTVDIDIRGHQAWIVDDLANQSINDLRRFFRDKMAPERSLENAAWLLDRNGDGVHDWHDLTEVKERIRLLEDPERSGKATVSHVFAEGFNEEINGVLAGVMPWKSNVFATVYPDLWLLRDTNHDGVADTRESLFRGFGVHAAFDGHDLHGLILGPDGKVYFSNGDNGFSVTNREGRRLHYPNTGGVLRMDPDGSNLEVFATGLRNPQEIAFDEYGNLFAVDNDGDLEDERERFVFISEGSDSGWRLNWQFRDAGWARYTRQPNYNPWTAERMWVPHFPGQPAHITPPITNYSVGPGSFIYNPGTALNEAYQRYFFLIQFPVQKVTAFQAVPRGAGFEMVHEHTVLSGPMISAVAFGPDGALYAADWDGMWEPNGHGAIWRLDDPRIDGSPQRLAVRQLLAEGMDGRTTEDCLTLLGHADMRIRLRAQFALAERGGRAELQRAALDTTASQFARIHALWGLGQIGRQSPSPTPELPWTDPDGEIRAQAARVAGNLRLKSTSNPLITLLRDPSARVRFQAALALGKVGAPEAVPALVSLLQDNNDQDPFLRHAGVMGLFGCGSPESLAALATHPSVAVRVAAVVALRRHQSPAVTPFLDDPDSRVRQEAVRAIHDDESIPSALPALARRLDHVTSETPEGVTRRLLNANLRLGDEPGALRLMHYAADPGHPAPLRIEAVECLAAWDRTPFLDRVEGRIRKMDSRVAKAGDRMIQENLNSLLKEASPALAQTLTRVVMENALDADPAVFSGWVLSPDQPAPVRAQALKLLARRNSKEFAAALETALAAQDPTLRQTAFALLASQDARRFLVLSRSGFSSLSLPEQQAILRQAGATPGTAATTFVTEQWDGLDLGRLPAELTLDVLESARARKDPALAARLSQYESRLNPADPLAKYLPALQGGDPTVGRELFRTHVNAQCVRCHEAGGDGHQAGPVLAGIARRADRRYLLEALIEPSARLAPGFATVSVTLRDGSTVEGIQVGESPAGLTVRQATGEVVRLAPDQIREKTASTVSAMPPMGEVLTPFELRDLVAYLASLK